MPDGKITAQTPDGVSHVFPAGTPDAVIDAAIKQHLGIRPGQGMAPQSKGAFESANESSTLGTIAREGSLGLTSGAGLPETTHASDFSILPGLWTMLRHPIESGKALGEAGYQGWKGEVQSAADKWKEPGVLSKVQSMGHLAASAIPFIGPAAGAAGEEVGEGLGYKGEPIDPAKLAHGAGAATGLLGTMALGKMGAKGAAEHPGADLSATAKSAVGSGPQVTSEAVAKWEQKTAEHINAWEQKTNEAVDNWKQEKSEAEAAHKAKVDDILSKHKADTMESVLAQAKKVEELKKAHQAKIEDINARHQDNVNKIQAQNDAAKAAYSQAQDLKGQVKDLQSGIGDHLSMVEESAKEEAKAKYPEIKGTIAPSEINDIVKTSLGKLQGSENVPPILKRILDETKPENILEQASVFRGAGREGRTIAGGQSLDEFLKNANPKAASKLLSSLSSEERAAYKGKGPEGTSKQADFNKVHGYYSEIGRELGNANLAGDVRAAMSNAYGELAKTMRKMADTEGKTAEFKEAQKNWKQYQDTWHNTDALKNGGSPLAHALRAKDPDFIGKPLTGAAAERAGKMLGEYGNLGAKPELLNLLRDKLNQLDALPSKLNLKELPTSPRTPKGPEFQPLELPSKPKLPEFKEPSLRVSELELPKDVDPQQAKQQALQQTATMLRSFRGRGAFIDLASLGHFLTTGNPILLSLPIARRLIGAGMSKPAVMKWLSSITPEELQTIQTSKVHMTAEAAKARAKAAQKVANIP